MRRLGYMPIDDLAQYNEADDRASAPPTNTANSGMTTTTVPPGVNNAPAAPSSAAPIAANTVLMATLPAVTAPVQLNDGTPVTVAGVSSTNSLVMYAIAGVLVYAIWRHR